MRGSSAQRQVVSRESPGDLEAYQRLIELQKQIIELAERNTEAERECARLRDQLARESEELFRSTQSMGFRLRRGAARLFRRWRPEVRPDFPPQTYRDDLNLLPVPRHAQNH